MRLLKFSEGALEFKLTKEIDGMQVQGVYKNVKPLEIYYNTNTLKIMNTLELVRLSSGKFKVKHSLEELVCLTNLEQVLRDWVKRNSEVAS